MCCKGIDLEMGLSSLLLLQLLHRGVDNIERYFPHSEGEVGGTVVIRTKGRYLMDVRII